jgi:hypothetical protein
VPIGSLAELDDIFERWTTVELALDGYVHRYHSPDDSEPELLLEARTFLKEGKGQLAEHIAALSEALAGRCWPPSGWAARGGRLRPAGRAAARRGGPAAAGSPPVRSRCDGGAGRGASGAAR